MSIVVQAAVSGILLLNQLGSSSDAILAGGADPTIVATRNQQGDMDYYVVATGRGIQMLHSPDLKNWKRAGRVFEKSVPEWAKREIPKARGIWAPDLSYQNGKFFLYYSVSSFGSQRSVIGLAVNETLDSGSDGYQWSGSCGNHQ